MSKESPALLPLFRSENQLAVLSYLVLRAPDPLTIAELARCTEVNDATVGREVRRLVDAGLLTVVGIGPQKRVTVDRDMPWFPELEGLLAKTAGAKMHLERVLADEPTVIEAYIFGSWAARYFGHAGRWPHDLDVIIVGDDLSPMRLRGDLADLEPILGVEVNPVFASSDEWHQPPAESFFARIKAEPLVPVKSVGDPAIVPAD